MAAPTTVADGLKLYDGTVAISGGGSGKCSACHYSGAPPSLAQVNPSLNHHLASNNVGQITAAINAGNMSYPGITAAELFKLSMYIGQYKAPVPSNATLSINTSVTNTGTVNVYPLLASDGTSGVAQDIGGLTSTNGSKGTTTADITEPNNTSIQYNLKYTRTDTSFVGTDTFTYTIINPAANTGVSANVTVTLVGITGGATGSGKVGTSATVYSITTNGTTSGANPYSVSSGTLPPGLTLNTATGVISGTPSAGSAGDYPITVSVNVSIRGTVQATTKDVTLRIAGITSAATATYTQNTAITTYQITALPAAIGGSYLISSGALPTGLSLNTTNGEITGTPTVAGAYSATVQANTSDGLVSQAVAITVNSAGVPVITTAPSLSASPAVSVVGTVGTAITNHQINASNPPITAGSYTATGLPNGLSVNASTGVISGTPTVSGDFTVALGASNASGAGTLNVIMRIQATAAPVINSLGTGTGTVGTNGTAYTITTDGTNGPLLSTGAFSVESGTLPAGLTLDVDTGVISGTPTTSGVSTVTLAAKNTGNVKGTKVVTFTITPNTVPVISSPGNGSTTALALGVAMTPITITASNPPLLSFALASGTLPTGVSLNTTTGVISGTPTTAAGASTVTLTASNGVGASAPITVTFSVSSSARANPLQDSRVTGLLAAQAEAAQRFSQAQIANFSRRLESLHGAFFTGPEVRLGTAAPVNGFSGARLAPTLAANNPQAAIDRDRDSRGAIQLPASNTQASLPLSSAVSIAAAQTGLSQSPLYTLASDLVQTRSINLGNLNQLAMGLTPDVSGESLPGPRIWAEGVVSLGSRDAQGSVSAADFRSTGVSFGMDRMLSQRLVVGMGVGYAQDTTNIGTDGTNNKARAYSLALYGSYKAGSHSFVDGLLGVGSLDFDMNRYVPAAGTYATSNRKGYQLFGSLGAGFEFRDKANLISPYARLDFSNNKLGENTETGAGTFALTYFEQTNAALQSTIGLRGESTHATRFGWAIPRARIEWRQDLSSSGEAAMSYADQVGGTRYAIASDGKLQSALVLGLGSEFVFRDGWSLGVDYLRTQVSDHESSYAVRIKVVKELGAKGLPKLLGAE